jgi:hypothetical protein
MATDRFDRIMIGLLLITASALAVQLAQGTFSPAGRSRTDSGKAVERQLAAQARAALLEKIYGPVTVLVRDGNQTGALLKLEEVNRAYPGEAHGLILKGEILYRLGALDEATANFAAGARLNGDYLDRQGPLSRRELVAQLVAAQQQSLEQREREQPGSPSLRGVRANLGYLRSRLAGGCE